MSALFDIEKLEALAGEGWLRRQRHPEADLWIYNYTERCQFEKHWIPETLACRGLILDAQGAVVARPFPKFFNLHELDSPPSREDGGYRVTEKMDGSLGIFYELEGEQFIASRGSFTSEQALEGTSILRDHALRPNEGATPLFEILYPANRIVCDYGKRRDLVLLAEIGKETGHDTWRLPRWDGPVVEDHNEVWRDLVDRERPGHEGYVIAFESGLRVKIKHADYVRLHRIITGVNARHIWEALRAGQDPTTELDGVPDEIFGWIEETIFGLRARYRFEEESAFSYYRARPPVDDRKEVAAYFQRCGGNPAILFRLLDGKPYEDLIWKAIRPDPTTPDTVWNQEVAA